MSRCCWLGCWLALLTSPSALLAQGGAASKPAESPIPRDWQVAGASLLWAGANDKGNYYFCVENKDLFPQPTPVFEVPDTLSLAGLSSPAKPFGVKLSAKKLAAELATLQKYKHLKSIHFSPGFVEPAELAPLRELPQLEVIDVSRTTAYDLRELKGLANLRVLSLASCGADDKSLATFKDAKQLAEVYLNLSTRLTGEGLEELTSLNKLAIEQSTFGNDGLKHLKNLKRLTSLALSFSAVDDKGLADLKQFPELTELRLQETHLTDAGLKELSALRKLKILDLGGNDDITDAGLKNLGVLPSLRELRVTGTAATEAGVAAFQKLHPMCVIHYDE